jgi:hypothetical protein
LSPLSPLVSLSIPFYQYPVLSAPRSISTPFYQHPVLSAPRSITTSFYQHPVLSAPRSISTSFYQHPVLSALRFTSISFYQHLVLPEPRSISTFIILSEFSGSFMSRDIYIFISRLGLIIHPAFGGLLDHLIKIKEWSILYIIVSQSFRLHTLNELN